MTSGIPKGKTKLSDEERKTNRKKWRKDNAEKIKKYHSDPKNKERRKERDSTPKKKIEENNFALHLKLKQRMPNIIKKIKKK